MPRRTRKDRPTANEEVDRAEDGRLLKIAAQLAYEWQLIRNRIRTA